MLEGQRVADAPKLDKASEDNHRVDDDGEGAPNAGDQEDRNRQAAGHQGMNACVALSGNGRVALPAQPGALEIECRKGEEQEYHGEHRRTPLIVLGADDGEENFSGKHVVVPAEHERIAEIGHALDEPQQKRVCQAWTYQRPGTCIVRNVCQRLARRVWAASSMDGLTPSTTPIRTRNAIGVKASVWAMRIPGRPYSHRVGWTPRRSEMKTVTEPEARTAVSARGR